MRSETSLDLREANVAIAAMREELRRLHAVAVMAVADAHGEIVAVERADGAPATSVRIAMNKAWTAANQACATRAIGDRVRGPETLDIGYYGDARICGWAGGLPVLRDGLVIGSVAVSGLPEDDDEAIAKIGLAAILGALGS